MNTTNSKFSTHVNFVPSPNSRGTLSILWSSLFTILACTWTVQHLNVPEQRNSCKPGWMGTLTWYTRKFLKSARWMIVTSIAPEVVIGMACYDLVTANITLRSLEKIALEDGVPWTLTHSYFANMGGFVIESGVEKPSAVSTYISMADVEVRSTSQAGPNLRNRREKRHEIRRQPLTNHLPSFVTGGVNEISYHNPYHLTGRQICQLRKEGILPRLPHISEAELTDRSKSDGFVKAIAFSQILWDIIQIIVRAARKLPISQLELAVIAFAVCAMIMYGLNWSKPKNIGAVTAVIQYEGPIPQGVLTLIQGWHSYLGYILIADDRGRRRHGSPIRNDSTQDDPHDYWNLLAILLGAPVFGGIHVAAWNFGFPTKIDLIIWRVTSLYSAACSPLLLFGGCLVQGVHNKDDRVLYTFLSTVMVLYIIARVALLVEIFRTLFFLPPLAYVSTWTKDIPHFG
ncbi:uncharacterized protein LY89DRAFT_311399 [Mollisia scopiformis]|uniref:Uncharacterized protein n=1 Tax=Mollisia scopiformis TaxID=149040 RepID=A0A194XRA6_MOLSC|nr:uncharacterized protein LY89DRAFT_311399 [Mollisia scopiformis]KUJ22820.1 hypothetical protein LY89DRAFT_311399 [Mollisia scopiformis]